MEDNSFPMFIIRYLICVGLLYYTQRLKKQNDLLKATIAAFILLSVMMGINYFLAMNEIFKNGRPFYEVNFVDFLNITLIFNAFIKQKGKKIIQQD